MHDHGRKNFELGILQTSLDLLTVNFDTSFQKKAEIIFFSLKI